MDEEEVPAAVLAGQLSKAQFWEFCGTAKQAGGGGGWTCHDILRELVYACLVLK